MATPENTPVWVAVIVTLFSALGIRELLATWLKQKGYNTKTDHARIKHLEAENLALAEQVGKLRAELATIKGIVRAWAQATGNEELQGLVQESFDEENN